MTWYYPTFELQPVCPHVAYFVRLYARGAILDAYTFGTGW